MNGKEYKQLENLIKENQAEIEKLKNSMAKMHGIGLGVLSFVSIINLLINILR